MADGTEPLSQLDILAKLNATAIDNAQTTSLLVQTTIAFGDLVSRARARGQARALLVADIVADAHSEPLDRKLDILDRLDKQSQEDTSLLQVILKQTEKAAV